MLDWVCQLEGLEERASECHEGTVTRKTANITRKEAIDVASEYR